WFSEQMLFEGNKQLFQHARQTGLAVSIDLNWDPHWGHSDAAKIKVRKQAAQAALPWVNLAHGNVRELKEFTDADDLDTALRRLTNWGVESVIVHMGAKGAGYYNNGSLIVEPPAPVINFVHAAGTGDVLSVCMMLLHNQRQIDIPSRLRLANSIVAEFIMGQRKLIPALAD
ncbi:MAG TPA: carbohydrate kinase family protein, partial [Humisphaera sp.]|nr:carbohydrate kinase family protein [Humisphaera sp.]